MARPKVEIKIVPVQRFRTYINGEDSGEFEVESVWEGFMKLRGKNGVIVGIADRDPEDSSFSSVFRDIFGSAFADNFAGGKEVIFEAVQISPALIPPSKED